MISHTPAKRIRALFLLILLAAFPPLSTDMYLPAIPSLMHAWNSTQATINLTLVGFFASFSVALLLYGPLSDRYGRKPVLMLGISIYVFSCLACSLADSAPALILGRIAQGFGAASASTLSLALTKDYFDGAERERAMAHMAIIVSLAPMLAPILGGLILVKLSWPWIFYTQALLGMVAIVETWRMEEPVRSLQTPKTLGQVLTNYLRLMRDLRFVGLISLVALAMCPLFGFIAASAHIYIRQFGLSEQMYSYFFAANALALMAGFWTCSRLLKTRSGYHLMLVSFGGIILGGVLLMLFGGKGPYHMALTMGVITFNLGLGRPPSNHFLLEQTDADAGSASSLIMFTYFVSGALSMAFASLHWPDRIVTVGAMAVVSSTLVLCTLPRLKASGKPKISGD